jgi:hypothetical protein
MSDIADDAQAHIEREMSGLLARRKPSGPIATGRCLNCDEIVSDERRWCDKDCHSDWDKTTRARRFKVDEE